MPLAKSHGWAASPSEATEARVIPQAWFHYPAMGTTMCPAQYSPCPNPREKLGPRPDPHNSMPPHLTPVSPHSPPTLLPVVRSWLGQGLGSGRWDRGCPGSLLALVPLGFTLGRPPPPWGSPLLGANLGLPSRVEGRSWETAGLGYPWGPMPVAYPSPWT